MSINISNRGGIRCMYGNSFEQVPGRPLPSRFECFKLLNLLETFPPMFEAELPVDELWWLFL